jgi:putative hemolysin
MIPEILLLLVLILLNGVFAMSEIAVVGSRRARLVQMAETSGGARRALALASDPTRFLSSVQIGITGIGILSGAIGEASIAARLRAFLGQFPAMALYAASLELSGAAEHNGVGF